MKITIETKWSVFSTELKNSDAQLEDIFSAIRGMLVSCGWQQSTIDEYIVQFAEEIKQSEDMSEQNT